MVEFNQWHIEDLTLDVDSNTQGSIPVIYGRQGDKDGILCNIELTQQGVPLQASWFNGKRVFYEARGNGVSVRKQADAIEGNVVKVVLPEAVFNQIGLVPENFLRVEDATTGELIISGTTAFRVYVRQGNLDPDASRYYLEEIEAISNEFKKWFKQISNTIGQDVAAELAAKVVELENEKVEVTTYLQSELTTKQKFAQTNEVLSGIDRIYGDKTYATAAELRADTAADKAKRYIVAADGKWYWWNGTAWTEGQVAQPIGIAENSIRTTNLYASETLDKVNLNEYVEIARTDRFYFEPSNLITRPSAISIEFKANDVRTGKVVMLKKITNNFFEITDTMIYTSKAGINYVETPFVANGTGDEYVTVINFSLSYKSFATVQGHYTTLNIANIMDHDVGDTIVVINETASGKIKMGYNLILSDFPSSRKLAKVEAKIDELSSSPSAPTFTLNDLYVSWKNNEKSPTAIWGDSTYEGLTTTGNVPNVLGTDHISPKSFSSVLQAKLRKELNNNVLRIYNAGFSGMTTSWAVQNLANEFGPGKPYSDAKMVGIGFLINDRLGFPSLKAYRAGVKNDLIIMILWFKANGIQPFLITTQAILSPGVPEGYSQQYPMRDAKSIETVANEVKRELAKDFNLELIDLNEFTANFIKYSAHSVNTIIPDKLHFGDIGHDYEADVLFYEMVPTVNYIDRETQIDYTNQNLEAGVGEDKLTVITTPTDGFKVAVNYTKSDSTDSLIFKTYVFNDANRKMTIKAFKSVPGSSTYVKLNGNRINLTASETTIGDVDLGLHTLEVFTGGASVDFKGFKIS